MTSVQARARTSPRSHALASTAALLLLAASAAMAGPASGTTPTDGGLSGPRVEPKATQPTLVRRDIAGKVVQLDENPAELALRLLKLDDATRAKVDAILTQRAKVLDKIVEDNLLLIAEISGLSQSGQREKAVTKLKELSDANEPLRKRGMLVQELNTVLSKPEQDELRRLVQEYIQARIQDAQDEAKAAGKEREFRPGTVARADMLHVAGKDIGRSYERVFGQKVADFEALMNKLGLTDAQRAEFSRLSQSLIASANGARPTKADQARVFAEMYRTLTPEQRKLLQAEVGPPAAPAPKPAAAPSAPRPPRPAAGTP